MFLTLSPVQEGKRHSDSYLSTANTYAVSGSCSPILSGLALGDITGILVGRQLARPINSCVKSSAFYLKAELKPLSAYMSLNPSCVSTIFRTLTYIYKSILENGKSQIKNVVIFVGLHRQNTAFLPCLAIASRAVSFNLLTWTGPEITTKI